MLRKRPLLPQPIVTRESLQELLGNPNKEFVIRVIGRALVAIMSRQTPQERVANATIEHNDIGFTGTDAFLGTRTAKYFLRNNTLADWQIERWVKLNEYGIPRLCKYAKQLNEIAQSKASNFNSGRPQFIEQRQLWSDNELRELNNQNNKQG